MPDLESPAASADLDALEERIVERVARACDRTHLAWFSEAIKDTIVHTLADELRRKL